MSTTSTRRAEAQKPRGKAQLGGKPAHSDRERNDRQCQGIDPVWREIAMELAGALRPYSLFREQRVRGGRIIVETAVPGSTLAAATAALEHLATHVAHESRLTLRSGAAPADDRTPWRGA